MRRPRTLLLLAVIATGLGVVAAAPATATALDPTTLSVSCSPGGPLYAGDLTVCTWVVTDTAHPASTPTGGLVIDGTSDTLGTLSHGSYAWSFSNNPPDVHYGGDSTHAPSNSVSVNIFQQRPTATDLHCPQAWPAGLPITCTVVVSDTSPEAGNHLGPSVSVTLSDAEDPNVATGCQADGEWNGTALCTVSFHLEDNPGTLHHLTATTTVDQYSDYLASAGTTAIDVGPRGTGVLTPSVTGLDAGTMYGQQPVVLTLNPPNGQPVPTGVVDVFDNGQKLFGDYLDASGRLTMPATRLVPGDHQLTMDYRGDTNYAHQAFGPFGVHIDAVPTRTSLTVSRTTVLAHQPTTFTATVVKTAGVADPTGYVVFFRDKHAVGERSLVDGTASWTTVFAKAGSHRVGARYVGLAPDGSAGGFAASSATTPIAMTVHPVPKGQPRPVGTFTGSTAPDLSGVDQYGNTVSLGSQRGKWVMLVFDQLWCPAGAVQESGSESLVRHMRAAHVPFSYLTVAWQNQRQQQLSRGDTESFARENGSWQPVLGSTDATWIETMRQLMRGYVDATAEQGGGIVPPVPEPELAYPTDVLIDPSGVVRFISNQRIDLGQLQHILHPSYRLPPISYAPDDKWPAVPVIELLDAVRSLTAMQALPTSGRKALGGELRTIAHRMDPVSPSHAALPAAFTAARATITADARKKWLSAHQASNLRYVLDSVADIINQSGDGGITPHLRVR